LARELVLRQPLLLAQMADEAPDNDFGIHFNYG
jgi:hypothetical protein